jgi:uncharacterized protein
MEVILVGDAASFLRAAAPVLDRDPAANNLPLGVAESLVRKPDAYEGAVFWIAAPSEGEPAVGAALRTPPYPLLLADPIDPAAVDAFVQALADTGTDLPGVTANEPWAHGFADGWSAATGVPWRLGLGQGVYALTEVVAPKSVPGVARPATDRDRALLERWLDEFDAEALTAMIRDERRNERAIERGLAADGSAGFAIWERDGTPVSLTGWSRIPGGARIGPVYTPERHRGHGYASNLVADVSERLLADGATACFLYTDLGNPTSNAIYRRIGYEQIAESSMILFGSEENT